MAQARKCRRAHGPTAWPGAAGWGPAGRPGWRMVLLVFFGLFLVLFTAFGPFLELPAAGGMAPRAWRTSGCSTLSPPTAVSTRPLSSLFRCRGLCWNAGENGGGLRLLGQLLAGQRRWSTSTWTASTRSSPWGCSPLRSSLRCSCPWACSSSAGCMALRVWHAYPLVWCLGLSSGGLLGVGLQALWSRLRRRWARGSRVLLGHAGVRRCFGLLGPAARGLGLGSPSCFGVLAAALLSWVAFFLFLADSHFLYISLHW